MRRKKGNHCFKNKREREAQTRRQRAAKTRGKKEWQTGRVGKNQTLIVLGAGREGRAKTSAALYVCAPYVVDRRVSIAQTSRQREVETSRERGAKTRGQVRIIPCCVWGGQGRQRANVCCPLCVQALRACREGKEGQKSKQVQEKNKKRQERIDILGVQKQAKQNLENKLLELTEIEDIEDITGCINMAIDHIKKANVSEPVVLEITTQTSRNYWETHLLPIKKRLMNDFDVKDDEFDLFKSLRGDTTKQVTTKVPEQMLKYGQIDTFNGYRLGTINENRKVYQLLLIQVIQGKLTLLSKLSGSLLSEPRHICNNNTWKNLTVREESANSIYTLPKFLSYFGSTSQPNRGQNSQLEYYFTLNNDRTGNSNTGTFYGKTSLMPQLRIAREFVKSRTNIVQTLDNPRAIQKLKLGIMNCKIMIMVLDKHHSNTQRVMKVTGQSSHQERANAERCIHIVDTLRELETLQRNFISKK